MIAQDTGFSAIKGAPGRMCSLAPVTRRARAAGKLRDALGE